MPGLLPDVDPDGLLEYSVVYSDRAVNHMSQSFQGVMRDISRTLKEVYKAQSAIESFFWRMGDALSALLVFVGTKLAFNISDFALTNIVLVLVWLAVAGAIVGFRNRERRSTQPEDVRVAA